MEQRRHLLAEKLRPAGAVAAAAARCQRRRGAGCAPCAQGTARRRIEESLSARLAWPLRPSRPPHSPCAPPIWCLASLVQSCGS
jgi:hypothetical protein